MTLITGRAVRIALAALAVTATFALPLALTGQQHITSAQSQSAGPVDEFGDPIFTGKPIPGDPTGSWVWDGKDSHG
ncbi:MAG TPA: hypothetical protein VIU15_37100 [Streptomyces sp.]